MEVSELKQQVQQVRAMKKQEARARPAARRSRPMIQAEIAKQTQEMQALEQSLATVGSSAVARVSVECSFRCRFRHSWRYSQSKLLEHEHELNLSLFHIESECNLC